MSYDMEKRCLCCDVEYYEEWKYVYCILDLDSSSYAFYLNENETRFAHKMKYKVEVRRVKEMSKDYRSALRNSFIFQECLNPDDNKVLFAKWIGEQN